MYSPEEIENAVAGLDAKDGGVTVEQAAGLLGPLPENEDEREALLERVARELDGCGRFFKSDGKYCDRAAFFNGRSFVIVPSEQEIDAGILFPGHRFAPFCSPEIYISDVAVHERGLKKPVPMREFECRFEDIFAFHSLLGSGAIYDLVVAEHPDNHAFLRGERNSKVKMTVFDLSKFYAKHNFSGGDALLVKIEDYNEGRFSITMMAAAKRDEKSRDLWIEKLENALAPVIASGVEYDEIPDMIAQGFFRGGAGLFGPDGATLDEFIALSTEVELRVGDDGTYLALHDDGEHGGDNSECDDDEHDAADCDCGHHHHHHQNSGSGLPDGLSLSSGATDSIPAILKEIGSTLTMNELDAFIFDEFATSDFDVDALYRRLFAPDRFADEAQEARFRMLFEERFETLQDHFDRFNDGEVAELRSDILAQVENRLQLLEDHPNLPESDLKVLAEAAIFFNELLAHIHRPAYNREEDPDRERLLDLFDEYVRKQQDVIDRFDDIPEQF
ncbi:MAG: hypothetical protein PHI85_07080 [Victivallaceae bacterium]|nr:hypothetical protein [Victivallaceae bacterium]